MVHLRGSLLLLEDGAFGQFSSSIYGSILTGNAHQSHITPCHQWNHLQHLMVLSLHVMCQFLIIKANVLE